MEPVNKRLILATVLLVAATSFAGTWLTSPGKGSHAVASTGLGTATFDGVNSRLAFGSVGMSGAGKVFTASFWVNTGNIANTSMVLNGRSGGAGSLWRVQITDRVSFLFQSSAPATIVNGFSTAVITNNTWYHVMISFDVSNVANRHIYINGANAMDTISTYTDTALALDRTNLYVGTDDDFGSDLDGCLAQVWIDDSYVDLSNSANRQKFYNGGSVNMGTDGNLTGAGTPNVYLRFVSGSLSSNSGTGGGTATVSGTVANGDCGAVP